MAKLKDMDPLPKSICDMAKFSNYTLSMGTKSPDPEDEDYVYAIRSKNMGNTTFRGFCRISLERRDSLDVILTGHDIKPDTMVYCIRFWKTKDVILVRLKS